jgi:alpha-amylase
LVTFIDSHDQIRRDNFKQRFAADAQDPHVIAAIGFLLCAVGVPCIYYGTEQGFSGHGGEQTYVDRFIRETMFDLEDETRNFLNEHCNIYQGISKIAHLRKELPALRFGRMYFRETSEDGIDFSLSNQAQFTLAFSRILVDQEILVAYNTSTEQERHDYVIVDSNIQKSGGKMKFLYGGEGSVEVKHSVIPGNHSLFVKLDLKPMQFVILMRET